MGLEYAGQVFLPIIAGLFLLQYSTRLSIFSAPNLPNLLTGLAWASAFPLLYAWTYNTPWYMSKVCFDFIIGTGIFVFLTALEALLDALLGRGKNIKTLAVLFALLNFVGWIIPFIQYAYYVMVWHCLTPSSLMALYLTNWRESIDFLEANVGYFWLTVIISVILWLMIRAYRRHVCFGKHYRVQGHKGLVQKAVYHGAFIGAWHRSWRIHSPACLLWT